MKLRLLGDLEVERDGEVIPVRGAKQRTILAVLALRRGEVVPADVLSEHVWSDQQPSNPVNALQAQISALRKLLGEPVLLTRGSGYALDTGRIELDLERFEQATAAGLQALAEEDPARATTALSAALALWRGPALADFAYEDFARVEVTRLEELRLTALEARLEADLAEGRDGRALAELDALCAEFPLRERLHEHRILALYRTGRQAEALRAFDEVRHRLVDELGVDPGPALQALHRRILDHDPALSAPTAAPVRRGGGNLPSRLSRFIGRKRDLDTIEARLAAGRLVSIIGPGGAGKTRLAIEAGHRLASNHPDGVWLVELATVTDADGVAPAFSAALEVGEAAAPREVPHGSSLLRLAAHLSSWDGLLIVDNCEHVVAEAATVVETLLENAPGLRVLTTSREPLGLTGEILHQLTPLEAGEAIELFADRAETVQAGFALDGLRAELVADICQRLDGLPLALELAAARLRALPLEQVAERLHDRFRLLTGGSRTAVPRQQTLRAVVDWSYELLFEDERRLFCRLSAFPGGCRLDVAEAICTDDDLPAGDVCDLLGRLVDKSLITTSRDPDGHVRHRQLQTLRDYGLEKLAETGEAEVFRDRQAQWYRALAVAASDGLRGASGPDWRRQLGAELENLRAALDWFIGSEDADGAIELATGIAWLWFLRGDWHEAVRWLGDALRSGGEGSAAVVARGRAWFAYFCAYVEDPGEHLATGAEARDALIEHGDPELTGEATLLLASSLIRGLRFDDALALLPEARRALADAGHDWGLAMCDLLVALGHARKGDIVVAEDAARRSVAAFEALGEQWAHIEPLGTIAALEATRGDHAAALVTYDRVIATARELDLPGYLCFWLVWRAAAATRLGDDEAAVRGFTEAAELSRNPVNSAFALIGLARALARLGDPARGCHHARQARELAEAYGRTDLLDAAASAVIACAFEAGTWDEQELSAELSVASAATGAPGHLAGAVVAAAGGDAAGARHHLRAWGQTVGTTPATVEALLAADHPHLERALLH